MTTTFSKFSLHLDLLPSTQRVQSRIRSVYLTFIKMSYKFPDPSEPFITSFLPPSSHSRLTQGRLDNSAETAFSAGQELHLQSATFRTSGDESTITFHDSLFDPCGLAIKLFILKRFSLTSPVNDGPLYAIRTCSFATHLFVQQSSA